MKSSFELTKSLLKFGFPEKMVTEDFGQSNNGMEIAEKLGMHRLQWPVRPRNPHACFLVIGGEPFTQPVVGSKITTPMG